MASEVKDVVECCDKQTVDEGQHMSKLRIKKNLIVLSLGDFFHHSSFMALLNLQSTLNNDGSVGVASQSVFFVSLILSALFLPKLIIEKIGCKLAFIFAILSYTPYTAANLYPIMSTMIPTAFLMGAGSATLWASISTYINQLSFLDADKDADKAQISTSKFFGIFVMFFLATQISGNMVSYLVLGETDSNSTSHSDILLPNSTVNGVTSDSLLTCGAEYCGGLSMNKGSSVEEERFMLVGIFLSLSVLAVLILSFFMDNLKVSDDGKTNGSTPSKLLATLKQMKKTDQLLLVVITTYNGLEQGFIFGDFPEAYIACAWSMKNVGIVLVCFGVVSAIVSISSGYLVKYIPRLVLVTTAAASNIGVCVALFLWKPSSDNHYVFFIIVGFWALSDAIWQTLLNALYGILFRSDEEAAFANYRLWEAAGFLIAFSCNSLICTSTKIYMQIAFVVVGMIGYVTVEYRTFRMKKDYSVTTAD